MLKHYDGLEVVRIPVSGSDIMTTASTCVGTVMNVIENGICVSPKEQQYIEYYGDQDPDW